MNIPLNIDWQQILLHLFNFAILAGGLYILLYRPVVEFMQKREEHYRDMDEQAKEAKAQADQLNQDYSKRLATIDAEIENRREEARFQLEEYRQQQTRQAQEEANQILLEARTSAEQTYGRIIAAAQKEIAGLAVTATERLVLQGQGDPYDQFLDLTERE